MNKYFQEYCKEKIKFVIVNSEKKAAVVERFNRTFQNNFYKILMMYPKIKRDIVSIVVKNYNATPHSVTGFIPQQVTEDNNGEILKMELDEREKLEDVKKLYVKSYNFKADYVRLSSRKMVFSKEYRGTLTEEIFQIIKRFRRPPNWNINLYKVKDMFGEELDGIFYEPELSKVYLPDEPREGKVIKRDKRKGKLVTLIDYPKGYSVWKK